MSPCIKHARPPCRGEYVHQGLDHISFHVICWPMSPELRMLGRFDVWIGTYLHIWFALVAQPVPGHFKFISFKGYSLRFHSWFCIIFFWCHRRRQIFFVIKFLTIYKHKWKYTFVNSKLKLILCEIHQAFSRTKY